MIRGSQIDPTRHLGFDNSKALFYVGTVPDYTYSETLDGSEIVWSPDTINDLFNQGPDHYNLGTKTPMQRIVQQNDRDDLIDYLRVATAKQGN